jgi:glycosyltransferase involved in cell wall biosynthesis
MDLSVIIATFNRSAVLKQTLASLESMTVPSSVRWELLVADNNSSDDTRAVVQEFGQHALMEVRYLFVAQQGKSFALNTAIQQARGEIIAFTDDDVTFDPNWLASLKRGLDELDCIAVGGKIIPVWNGPLPSWFQWEGQQAVVHLDLGERPKELNFAIGANAAFRREAFEKYGLFETKVGVSAESAASYEDDEFGHRLIRGGEKIMYVPEAIVYHPVAPHRLTKAYFRRWFRDSGRMMIKARIWPENSVLYAGIPRYLFRELIENLFKWPVTFDKKLRFRRELLVRRATGGILEGLRIRWSRE